MKKIKIVLSAIICMSLLTLVTQVQYIPANAAAEKTSTCVAIGDSILTGYGLVNFNENDKKNIASANNFVNMLSRQLNKKAVNLGVEGIDSTQLLKAISKPLTSSQKSSILQIKNADTIVLSIGGNNVFIPILNAVNDKIKDGKTIFTASAQEIQIAALRLIFDKPAMKRLQNTVMANTLKFSYEFEGIIKELKNLNPKAQIIVLTVYNPYKTFLPKIFNEAIISMNDEIINGSSDNKNYKVADVYSAFDKADAETILVNVAAGRSFDPHPTAKGHKVIYTLTAYAAQDNTLPYAVKSIISKGKLTTEISEGELILTITPNKGYNIPKYISMTIGKGARKVLALENGVAKVAIAEIDNNITVNGVCRK